VNVNVMKGFVEKQVPDFWFVFFEISEICRDGLVGYDAALTQLRSWVQFPVFVLFFYLFASSALQHLVPLLCTTFPHGYSSHSLGLLI
jgi:hypothetical protein